MLASNKRLTEGHKARHQVVELYKDKLDVYGSILGKEFMDPGDLRTSWHDKSKSLLDYRFSVVIENDSYSNYYTEKLTDCFASGTIPIYWGSPTVKDMFNSQGIITVNSKLNVDDLNEFLYNYLIDAVKDNYERVRKLESADDRLYRLVDSLMIHSSSGMEIFK
jgi:hypothetical protein